ncbi:MAG: energy-coupling factor transporter transmembrane protein EcfT [Ruminococcus sp.]|nr:energy-coupling factor transporter transmembrane protein EcfT [Ruminococcus sp.]
MGNSELSRLHPLTLAVYFTVLLGAGAFTVQPVFAGLSLIGAVMLAIRLCGREVLKKAPLLLIPLLLAAAINVLFNHRGVTVLAKLPTGNEITLEALIYGLITGFMLSGAVVWVYCFGKLFTSDKLMCLTGRLFPALTVVISMTVRFIPLFARRFREISAAQAQLGFGISVGGIRRRLRNLARVFSILISRSLEESIRTADSMKSRGYGLSGRSSFHLFRFTMRDAVMIGVVLLLGGYVIYGEIVGMNEFRCYPRFYMSTVDLRSAAQLCAFGALSLLPAVYELWEDHKWRSLRSKI